MAISNRGPNPFAPLAKQRNDALITNKDDIYQTLEDRVEQLLQDPDSKSTIDKAITELKQRLNGEIFEAHHFGRLVHVPLYLLDINIDIQRDLIVSHIADTILTKFDPRVFQPVNCTFIKATGRYSAWDGQQSSAAVYILSLYKLIAPDFLVPCKVVDDDLTVPGSKLFGEASGNSSFRTLNNSRDPIDAFWMHRSRVSGVRNYGSELTEDLQAEEIQQVFEKNNMFPAKTTDGYGTKAKPGMITHITACNNIAGLGLKDEEFKVGLSDLDRTLAFHNKYFPYENGVNGVFIIAMGRLYAQAREDNIKITSKTEDDLAAMIIQKYLSPHGFHSDCKKRLKIWQKKNHNKESWSDSCVTPILVLDYLNWPKSKGYALPHVSHMGTYNGV